MKWIDYFNKYRHKVNKYHVTIIIFLVITFFVGENTLVDVIRYQKKINALQKEIESAKRKNDEISRQLEALQGNRESLEKFARELFLMTKDDEELFLIEE